MTRSEAQAIRTALESAAVEFTDETALTVKWAFPVWTPKVYAVGDRVQHGGKLYKCVQAHAENGTYIPGEAKSLWAEVLPGQDGSIGEWTQPDSTNPYMKGNEVMYNGVHYRSTIDYNVYAPPTGWEVIE